MDVSGPALSFHNPSCRMLSMTLQSIRGLLQKAWRIVTEFSCAVELNISPSLSTLGPDGFVVCLHLTGRALPVFSALCVTDPGPGLE